MTGSKTEQLLDSVQRGVLGLLIAVLGVLAFGVTIRAFPAGNYLIAVLAGVFTVGAAIAIILLFVEGLRSE